MRWLLAFIIAVAFSVCDAKVIKVGSSMGFTGPYSMQVKQIVNGIKMAFDEANRREYLGGDRLKFIAYDDGYNAATTVSNLQKLFSKDKVDFLLAVFGTPPSIAAAERLDYYRSIMFFPITGFSQIYRGEISRRVFTLFPSYQDEAEQLVELAKKDGVRSLGVVYYTNLYGFDVLNAVEGKAKVFGIKLYRYPLSSYTDVSSVVEKVLSERPDGLLLAIPLSYLRGVLEGLARNNFYPALYSEFYSRVADALATLPPSKAKKFKRVYTGVFVPLLNENYPVVKSYLAAAERAGTSPNLAEFGGYMLGRTLVLILRRAGEWRNAEDLMRKVESIKNLDVGLPERISYSKNDHVGLTRVFIYRVRGGSLVPVR